MTVRRSPKLCVIFGRQMTAEQSNRWVVLRCLWQMHLKNIDVIFIDL